MVKTICDLKNQNHVVLCSLFPDEADVANVWQFKNVGIGQNFKVNSHL